MKGGSTQCTRSLTMETRGTDCIDHLVVNYPQGPILAFLHVTERKKVDSSWDVLGSAWATI